MAGYDYVGAIMAFEDGQMDREGAVELLTYLRDNGMLSSMQGCYGRAARALGVI